MSTQTDAKRAYSLAEAAAQTPFSIDTLRRAIKTTDPTSFPPPLRAKKPSKGYVILARDLDAWLDSLADA